MTDGKKRTQKRQSNSYVLKRIAVDNDSKFAFVIAEAADSCTDGKKKALDLASKNPGEAYCVASLWPPVIAREIRRYEFQGLNNPLASLDDSASVVDYDASSDDSHDDSAPKSPPTVVAAADASVDNSGSLDTTKPSDDSEEDNPAAPAPNTGDDGKSKDAAKAPPPAKPEPKKKAKASKKAEPEKTQAADPAPPSNVQEAASKVDDNPDGFATLFAQEGEKADGDGIDGETQPAGFANNDAVDADGANQEVGDLF